MTDGVLHTDRSGTPDSARNAMPSPHPQEARRGASRSLTMPVAVTLSFVCVAVFSGWITWQNYMEAPWTRDGVVRAYVVTMASEVAGRVVDLRIVDNQFVRRGDLLMVIDPTDYTIALQQAEAASQQAKAVAENAQSEFERRRKLTTLSISEEQQQIFASNAVSSNAAYQQALATLERARVNLNRTRIVSPVDGYVTNLLVQLGDYVTVGQRSISVINADSFWIDGYFEESALQQIHRGDPARIKLMGDRHVMHGRVESIARGITTPNAQPDSSGLASVNPIFTWVRLAQRIPVRIRIDEAPQDVPLAAGMTATVEIEQPNGDSSGVSLGASLSRRQVEYADSKANQGGPGQGETR